MTCCTSAYACIIMHTHVGIEERWIDSVKRHQSILVIPYFGKLSNLKFFLSPRTIGSEEPVM
jgi:hypothetical protein